MHSIIAFLMLISHASLGLIYNDKCTKKCDQPGLICVNDRCVCDSKARLFWTNVRCAPCPNDWTMTETACIAFYETEVTWPVAKSTCRNVKAELISFRNRDLISLIYTATNQKISPGSMDKLSAWTSAHLEFPVGVYQWLDKNASSFDSKSDWWCKKTTAGLGYTYSYDEPTRYTDKNNETEACVVYWRGKTTSEVLCLDDQLCSRKFPFVCEKSESTANQYIGPPPVAVNLFDTTTDLRATIIHNIPSNVGTIIINTANHQAQPKKNSSSLIVVITIIFLLLSLLILLGGLFFYLKRRNAAARPILPILAATRRVESVDEPVIKDDTNSSEVDLPLDSHPIPVNPGINIDSQKQQKGKRAGYSKQQFDEFE